MDSSTFDSNTPTRRRAVVAVLAFVIVGLLALVHVYRPAARGLWTTTLYDAMHAPVFGIIGLCLYGIVSQSGSMALWHRLLWSLAASCALAVASEAAQMPTERDASLDDLLTDCLGAAGFLFLTVACLPARHGTRRPRARLGLAGSAALAVVFLPLATVSTGYLERNARLPELAAPDALLGDLFWRRQNAAIAQAGFGTTGRPAYRVSLSSGPWPGMIFHDVWPDWHGYETLVVELGNGESRALEVHFRVHDKLHRIVDQPYSDRYNGTFPLPPGVTELRIPLSTIRDAPANRPMDLRSIDGMALFCDAGNAGREFYLLGIRLE